MNARFTALLLIFLLAGCAAAGPADDDAAASSSAESEESSEAPVAEEEAPVGEDQGTFVVDEETGAFYGSVYVEGYPEVVEVSEAFCEANCPIYDYVYFTLLQPIDPTLLQFLSQNEGNAYAGPGAIGLGCVVDGMISYANATDAEGMLDHFIGAEATALILGSTPENAVRLRLDRGLFTGGMGAPTCYAHFTVTEVFPAVPAEA